MDPWKACVKASGGKTEEFVEEFALAGRLMELDNPTLLRIARQTDLRTLVALEGTCQRLNAVSKEAGDYGAIRQLAFAVEKEEVEAAGVQIVLTTAHNGHTQQRSFRVRLNPQTHTFRRIGLMMTEMKVRLAVILVHLLFRGARPASVRLTAVGLFSDDWSFDFLSPSLELLVEDARMSALQSLVIQEDHEGRATLRRCNHEKIFAKRLSQLVGLSCTDQRCRKTPSKYSSLRYARLDHFNYEEGQVLLKQLRCFVDDVLTHGHTRGLRISCAEKMERMSGGRLKLRGYTQTHLRDFETGELDFVDGAPAWQLRMAFAVEDFGPAELKPLFLGHIWEEFLPKD